MNRCGRSNFDQIGHDVSAECLRFKRPEWESNTLELKPGEPHKANSFAESAYDSIKKAAERHLDLEAAALTTAGIAAGLLANRFHVSVAVECFYPKASSLLGGATEDLLQEYAASERLPKFLKKLPISESLGLSSWDIANRPFVAPLERVTEVFTRAQVGQFVKPILTENADTVAAIFSKHMDSPQWSALKLARDEAEKVVHASEQALPIFPDGTPYTSNRDRLRELTLKHFGEDGLRKREALDAATLNRNALLAQSSAPDRLPILQNAFDDLSDSFSLPRINVDYDKDSGSQGLYRLGTDRVFVKQSHLEGEDYAALFATSAHELTHVEEGSLMLRSMADKLGVGVDATEAQVELLKQMHEDVLDIPVTNEFLSGVLKVRNGQVLSFDENMRAEKILHGFLDDRSRMLEQQKAGIELQKLLNLRLDLRSEPTWKVLSEYHGEHLSPQSEKELEKEDAIRQFIRSQNPEVDRLVRTLKVDDYGNPAAWSDEVEKARRRELTTHLSKRTEDLRKSLDEFAQGYYLAFHEKEARATAAAVSEAFVRLTKK